MTDLFLPLDVLGKSGYPSINGYGFTHSRPVESNDFGLSVSQFRYARSGTSRGRLTFMCDDSKIAYFLGWLANEAEHGTLWFWAPIKGAGVLELKEMQVTSPDYSEGWLGPKHQTFSFDVITRRSMTMDAETYALVQEYGGIAEYAAAMDEFNEFAESLPTPTFAEE